MKKLVMLAIAGTLLVTSSGCSTIFKEGIKAGMGGRGAVAALQSPSSASGRPPLAEYENFELGGLDEDFGGMVPAEFYDEIPGHFRREVGDANLPVEPGGKTALIRGTIIHYEGKDLVGSIVSPLDQVIVRAEMVDKQTGEILGRANLVGRTTSRTRRGPSIVAEGYARAAVEWFSENYFPPEE
jgi:hypothetical protein